MSKFKKEIEKLMFAEDKKVNRKLYAMYSEMQKEILKEVEAIYEQNDELEFLQKLKVSRLAALNNQIDNQLQIIKGKQKESIYDYLSATGKFGFNELFYDFEMTEGFPLSFNLMNDKLLARIINTPVANFKLSTRLDDGFVNRLRNNIKAELQRSFARGEGYAKAAQRISEVGQSSYKRALNIARTEGGRVSSVTRQLSQNEATEAGARIKKQWVSTLDGSTRDTHAILDGTIIAVDEYFQSAKGRALQPHMFGIASEDCNCRCRTINVIEGYEPSLRKDNETKEVIEYENYQEWEEIKNKQWLEKIENTAGSTYVHLTEKDFITLQKKYSSISMKDKKIVYNKGNGYIGTPNSFYINDALRGNNLSVLTKESKDTIERLTALINSRELDKNIITNRWVDNKFMEAIAKQTGHYDMMMFYEALADGIVEYSDSGFVSTSLVSNLNVFKNNRNILLEIKVPDKTNIYISLDKTESEMILQRDSIFLIEGMETFEHNNQTKLKIIIQLLRGK